MCSSRGGLGVSFSVFVQGVVFCALVCTGCSPDRDRFVPEPGKYEVRILRDNWGVPHVFGTRDVDVAYGLAWANCEDDWRNIEDCVLLVRSRMAAVRGRDAAKFDYIALLFRVAEFVDEKYDSLTPEVRALVEAYAEGVTHYAAAHPEKMPSIDLPVTGRDIVANATMKAPFFYGLHNDIAKVMGGSLPISKKGVMGAAPGAFDPFAGGLAIGSNAWAVGPKRSADGATRLAINSHQPWPGPVSWYEAHLHSDEGWNMVGGTFPGGPLIFKGHDARKGWCHTINRPDLADVYELELNPDNADQYRFDGEWRDFEKETARITVKLWGPVRWTFKRELLWSEQGPVFRTEQGARAIRFAGYGEVRHLDQWYRMNKARDVDEFLAAMKMHALSSLNTLYADKDGNLYYAYNAQFPDREEGYDWKGSLPGDAKGAVWTKTLPFSMVPQVLNPPSGFVQNCNSTPFRTTDGPGNPVEEAYPASMGIEAHMTNRALRAMELYGADDRITREEFYAYKYDKTYSAASPMAAWLARVLNAPAPEDPLLKEAVYLLRGWDRCAEKESRVAALAILAHGTFGASAREEDPFGALRKAAELMMARHGRLDVPWEEMMRLKRGDTDLGLGGCPDCLRALDEQLDEDGRFHAVNGDCYFLMVEWDTDGRVSSEAVHQFGAASTDPDSPHYADQAPLFARQEMRPTLLTEEAVRANLKREYRPGELAGPWYAEQ